MPHAPPLARTAQFSSRTGWGAEPSDASPIFVQFLDAAWQLLQQFPTEFEFNENLLLLLAKHAYSRWFGDFLHDSENQRCSQSIQTVSVWSHVACEKPRWDDCRSDEQKVGFALPAPAHSAEISPPAPPTGSSIPSIRRPKHHLKACGWSLRAIFVHCECGCVHIRALAYVKHSTMRLPMRRRRCVG